MIIWTGAKDKNGVEIYEKDIVLIGNDKFTIEYGIQHVDAFEGFGFNFWEIYGNPQDLGKAIRLQEGIEVIGSELCQILSKIL